MTQTTETPARQGNGKTQVVTVKEHIANLGTMIEKRRDNLMKSIPKHINLDRLIRVALSAISRNARLLECTPGSILMGFMQAAELGLELNNGLGQAYLVPFWNKNIGAYEAQFIPGYRGLIDLARRSGNFTNVEAHVVHSGDTFKVVYGLQPQLVHEPAVKGDPGEPIAVYAIAWPKDGKEQFDVMTAAQVGKIRKRSKAADNGPWVTDEEEMWRKTVVRRLCKYLPLSPEMAQAIEADEQVETGEGMAMLPDLSDMHQATASKTATLADKLRNRLTEVPPANPEQQEPNVDEAYAEMREVSGSTAEPDVSGVVDEQPPDPPAEVKPKASKPAKATVPDAQADHMKFMAELDELAAAQGIDVEQYERGVGKFMVSKGLKGREHEMTAADRAELSQAVTERRGHFAPPTAE